MRFYYLYLCYMKTTTPCLDLLGVLFMLLYYLYRSYMNKMTACLVVPSDLFMLYLLCVSILYEYNDGMSWIYSESCSCSFYHYFV